jgi:hemoglobin
MRDIENRDDIIHLVNTFYTDVKADKTIGNIFTKVVAVDWDAHLPKMYDFWEGILLGGGAFKGNPMQAHIGLSKKTEMGKGQFDAWQTIWNKTIDTLFEGDKAAEAKLRANNIAQLMLYKIQTA